MEPIRDYALFCASQGITGTSPGRSDNDRRSRVGEGHGWGRVPGIGRTYEPTGELDWTALQKASIACGLPSRMAVMKDGSGTVCWSG